jgi:hypothetical protein
VASAPSRPPSMKDAAVYDAYRPREAPFSFSADKGRSWLAGFAPDVAACLDKVHGGWA